MCKGYQYISSETVICSFTMTTLEHFILRDHDSANRGDLNIHINRLNFVRKFQSVEQLKCAMR